MKKELHSHFAPYIQGLIEHKRALGYKYLDGEIFAYRFDAMCFEHFPDVADLTQEIVFKWAENTNNNSGTRLLDKMCMVRSLAKYMNQIGVLAYVLPTEFLPKKKKTYVPHIYTKDELSKIFTVADTLQKRVKYPVKHYVVPVIYRLLYSTGMRPNEAISLRRTDINLKTGELRIEQSKNVSNRKLVLSNDMLQLCVRYDRLIESILPNRDYFFQGDSSGQKYGRTWLHRNFRLILAKAGLREAGCDGRMRLYDLRHSFATHRLQKWIDEGCDINAKLPYLCAYLGHQKISNTAYYIHLVPEQFREKNNTESDWYANLLPEVEYED